MPIIRLSTQSDSFAPTLRSLLAFDASQDESIERATAEILKNVQEHGDQAVLDYTRQCDRVSPASFAALEIDRAEWLAALNALPADQRQALVCRQGV